MKESNLVPEEFRIPGFYIPAYISLRAVRHGNTHPPIFQRGKRESIAKHSCD